MLVDVTPPPARPCRLLAFDTATEVMSLAVVTPQQVWSVDAEGGAMASSALIPSLLALLAQAGCRLQQLDAIAYGCGPGAFTGLRTTCSVAQGLACGADKPVLPVDSLMLVAESVREVALEHGAHTVWVAQDARMDEVYAAAYRWHEARPGEHRAAHWETTTAPALYTLPALNQRWAQSPWTTGHARGSVVIAGSALTVMGERLHSGGAPRLGAAVATTRARALANLAITRWEDGALLDAADAVPLYLRDKVAQTTEEREAARAAKELV